MKGRLTPSTAETAAVSQSCSWPCSYRSVSKIHRSESVPALLLLNPSPIQFQIPAALTPYFLLSVSSDSLAALLSRKNASHGVFGNLQARLLFQSEIWHLIHPLQPLMPRLDSRTINIYLIPDDNKLSCYNSGHACNERICKTHSFRKETITTNWCICQSLFTS